MFIPIVGAGVPLNIDWQQILLHLFNFAVLALGLYLLLYKPIKNFIEKRKNHYEELDEQAAKKLADADAAKAEYAARLVTAEAEIDEMTRAQIAQAESVAKSQLDLAKEQSEKILSVAREDAKKERDKILEGAKDEITQLAVVATEKLLAENSPDIYEQFLSAVEKENKGG